MNNFFYVVEEAGSSSTWTIYGNLFSIYGTNTISIIAFVRKMFAYFLLLDSDGSVSKIFGDCMRQIYVLK